MERGVALTFDPARDSAVVRSFLQSLVGDHHFNSQIHVADEMFLFDLESLRRSAECAAILYLLQGYQILQTLRQVVTWRFGGFQTVRSFLDFASGYGRLTRFLVRELPAERIWVSDIYADAVDFQSRSFGVQGAVSVPQPEDLTINQRFDCILASSFFSHLPKSTFGKWLERLMRLLNPGGILLFSVHGSDLLPDQVLEDEGIFFKPESESSRLDKRQYGTSYVTERFVVASVAEITRGEARLHRFPRGFCGLQDLYVVATADSPDLATLDIASFPTGDTDLLEFRDDETVALEGWASGPESLGPVRLLIQNKVVEECIPTSEAAHCGTSAMNRWQWKFLWRADGASPDDIIMVKAAIRESFDGILSMGTLRPYLPAKPPWIGRLFRTT